MKPSKALELGLITIAVFLFGCISVDGWKLLIEEYSPKMTNVVSSQEDGFDIALTDSDITIDIDTVYADSIVIWDSYVTNSEFAITVEKPNQYQDLVQALAGVEAVVIGIVLLSLLAMGLKLLFYDGFKWVINKADEEWEEANKKD